MGNIPVVHETMTSLQSLGHAVAGDIASARRVWGDYAERSIVGSGVYSAIEACKGNHERARCLGQGMGRATAGVLVISRNIPILHEIAVASDSLGDCIAGEPGKASEHWKGYVENSVIGSCGAAVKASINNNEAEVKRLLGNCGKSLLKAGMEGAVLTATVATASAAAPAGMLVAASSTAVASSATSTVSAVCSAALDGKLKDMTPGALIGTSLTAAATGAAAGALAVRKLAAELVVEPLLSVSSVDRLPSGFSEPPNPRLWNTITPAFPKNVNSNTSAEGQLTELLESRDSVYVTSHHASYGNVIELDNTKMEIGFRWRDLFKYYTT